MQVLEVRRGAEARVSAAEDRASRAAAATALAREAEAAATALAGSHAESAASAGALRERLVAAEARAREEGGRFAEAEARLRGTARNEKGVFVQFRRSLLAADVVCSTHTWNIASKASQFSLCFDHTRAHQQPPPQHQRNSAGPFPPQARSRRCRRRGFPWSGPWRGQRRRRRPTRRQALRSARPSWRRSTRECGR